MRAPGGRDAPGGILALTGLVLVAVGCSSPFAIVGGRYLRADGAYSVAAPGTSWEREEVDGTDLSFRRADGVRFSLVRSCHRPMTDVQLMARQLLIGARERQWVQSGPVVVGGRAGWSQTVVVRSAGRAVRLRTITLLDPPCTYDFILASPVTVEAPDREFDAWWSTFTFGASSAPESEAAEAPEAGGVGRTGQEDAR